LPIKSEPAKWQKQRKQQGEAAYYLRQNKEHVCVWVFLTRGVSV